MCKAHAGLFGRVTTVQEPKEDVWFLSSRRNNSCRVKSSESRAKDLPFRTLEYSLADWALADVYLFIGKPLNFSIFNYIYLSGMLCVLIKIYNRRHDEFPAPMVARRKAKECNKNRPNFCDDSIVSEWLAFVCQELGLTENERRVDFMNLDNEIF